MAKNVSNKKPPQKATATPKVVKEKPIWIYPLGIVAFTFILFYSLGSADFVNWDDPAFVLGNNDITSLSFHNISNIFSTFYLGNYCPLSILSYAIDHQISGVSPTVFHIVSLLFHLVNTYLVFWFVYQLTNKQLMVAVIASLLFGIHPMHVESVAWVSERRDVLYTMFFLLGLIGYLRYVSNNYSTKYLIYTLLFFLGSLLSKGQAVTFPLILLVIDYIQNRKFDKKSILEKVPFFILSLVFGLVALKAQKETPAVNVFHLPVINSIFSGIYGLMLYIAKCFVPFQLGGYQPYPFKGNETMPMIIYLSPIIIIALIFLLFKTLRNDRKIIGGFLFFVLCIFPVLQFLPLGETIISERYTYLPYIGLFFVIGHVYQNIDQYPLFKGIKQFKTYILVAFIGILSFITFNRGKVWNNSIAFWTDVIDQFPNYKIPYNNRGYMYNEFNEYELAIKDFNKGIAIDSTYGRLYLNRGLSYERQKMTDLALRDYTTAIKYDTTEQQSYLNRGSLYTDVYSKFDSGISDFKNVLRINPNSLPAINNMGVAYYKKGDYDNAILQYNKSIDKNQSDGRVYYLRALVYAAKKDYAKALADGKQSKQLGFAMDDKLMQEWGSQVK